MSLRNFAVHFRLHSRPDTSFVEPHPEVDPESLSVSSQSELALNNSSHRNRELSLEKPKAAIDIRLAQLGVFQLRLRTADPGILLDELSGKFANAPQFFRRAAVCVDLFSIKPVPDLNAVRAILDAVRRVGMIPVGLSGDLADVEPLAVAVNLPVLSNFRGPAREASPEENTVSQPAPESVVVPTLEVASPAAAVVAAPAADHQGGLAMVHTQMVRSGQRLYARQRDLIISAGVASGAEVMADGSVHVYGPLRGRAIAGARDAASARIFCQEFHAELVSIAGVFRNFETIPPDLRGKPVQVWLDGDKLHCTRIGS